MQKFKVEYLITVDQKYPFCSSVAAFNNLLRTIDDITVTNSSIEYKSLKVNYELQMGAIEADKQKYFHIKITSTSYLQAEEEIDTLLRSIRTILSKASGKAVQILWDDIGFYYAQKSYPLIFEVENIMRKLITKFMLINIGFIWTNESIPKEVAKSIRSRTSAKHSSDYLYETDFIQLSNFLFKEYAIADIQLFTEKIRLASNIEDLVLSEMKLFVPRSNWERYFSALVNCESDYIKKRWDKLYEKRNQIAHNKSISKRDFDDINQLIDQVKPKLQDAINKLDLITVSEEDREAVAENAAETNNALFGEFLQGWKLLTNDLYNLAVICPPDRKYGPEHLRNRHSAKMLSDHILRTTHLLTPDFRQDFSELNHIRNLMLHELDMSLTEEAIQSLIDQMHKLRNQVIFATESMVLLHEVEDIAKNIPQKESDISDDIDALFP